MLLSFRNKKLNPNIDEIRSFRNNVINENTKKLELLTTEKEKSTTETIINGLKNQVNILDQLISAQYVHKNNSLKA